ncbi:MAG TPA: hypothetical protein VFM94_04510 [Solirubrobacterales bacterium]|nr:hypothetical protein [Solirubrobacterales bacterium]
MNSIEIRRARGLVVAIGLLVAALAYAEAQGSVAGERTALTGTSESPARSSRAGEAEAALTRANLRSKLEAALGTAFGGMWFEPSTAQMHVGVTSPASRQTVEALAARVGLSEFVTETPVQSTSSELEAAQDRWNRRLTDLFENGQVATSLAPDSNSVKVELGSSVPSSRRSTLEREASDAAVDVSIEVAPDPRLRIIPATRCKKWAKMKAYCDKTIVAGVTVDSEKDGSGNRGTCTAGPPVVLKDQSTAAKATKTYLLTAGHCIQAGGGEGKKWYSYNKAEEEKEIGTAGPYINGKTDIGVIEVNTSYWALPNDLVPVVPALAIWNSSFDFNPTSIANSVKPTKNEKTCFSGQRSEVKCGEIIEEGYSYTFDGKPEKTENLYKVELENGAKGGKGDSGGPFYSAAAVDYLEGTFVAYDFEDAKKEEGNIVYFHSLDTSLAELAKVKSLDLALLRKANEKRKHPVAFTADQYSATVKAKSTGEDKFTGFGATVTCAEGEFDGLLGEPEAEQEGRLTLELAPSYPKCTSTGGIPAKFTSNECKYKLTPQEKVTEGHYVADVAVACPEGKPGLQLRIYASHTNMTSETPMCTLTIPPQSGLKKATLTNSSGDIVLDAGAVEGFKVKIHRNLFLCPSSGTENETTGGVYHVEKSLTFAGTKGGEPVDIDMTGG